jgi:hypothetical protein
MLTGLQKKELSIEYKIAQPDYSTLIDVINAWFALRIEKAPRKEAMQEHVVIIIHSN